MSYRKYSNDPREMTAKFPSKCAESGQPINKGDSIIYYPIGKFAFKIGSAPKAEADFRQFQALAYEEDNGFCTW